MFGIPASHIGFAPNVAVGWMTALRPIVAIPEPERDCQLLTVRFDKYLQPKHVFLPRRNYGGHWIR